MFVDVNATSDPFCILMHFQETKVSLFSAKTQRKFGSVNAPKVPPSFVGCFRQKLEKKKLFLFSKKIGVATDI
jgi:hypothetical protein